MMTNNDLRISYEIQSKKLKLIYLAITQHVQ